MLYRSARGQRESPCHLDAYRAAAKRIKNLDLHIFPGVQHGYMMRDSVQAFSQETYDFSMKRALAILEGLRG